MSRHVDTFENRDQKREGGNQQQGGDQIFKAAGQHRADIRIDEGRGQLSESRGQDERTEGERGESRKITDGIEGHEGQKTADENRIATVSAKVVFDFRERFVSGVFFDNVPAETAGDVKTDNGADHRADPGKQRALPPSEQRRIGEGDEEGRNRGDDRLEDHQQKRDRHRVGPVRADEREDPLTVRRTQNLDDTVQITLHRRHLEIQNETDDENAQNEPPQIILFTFVIFIFQNNLLPFFRPLRWVAVSKIALSAVFANSMKE